MGTHTAQINAESTGRVLSGTFDFSRHQRLHHQTLDRSAEQDRRSLRVDIGSHFTGRLGLVELPRSRPV